MPSLPTTTMPLDELPKRISTERDELVELIDHLEDDLRRLIEQEAEIRDRIARAKAGVVALEAALDHLGE